MPKLGVKLGAFVDRSGRRSMPDDGTDVEGDGAHVEEHTRDVYQRGEEEDSLAPEESR